MMRIEKANEQPIKGDFEENMKHYERWKKEKKFPSHMSAQVSQGEHKRKAIVFIAYNPPIEWPIGNQAMPVSMLQDKESFVRDLEQAFKRISETADRINTQFKGFDLSKRKCSDPASGMAQKRIQIELGIRSDVGRWYGSLER